MLEIMLDEFHFSSLWNGGILLFTLFGAIIYLFMLPNGKHHSIWKTIAFLGGLLISFLAIGSPLNIIARIQFSAHVFQIALLFFIAPPLLVIGFKTEILKRLFSIGIIAKIARFITHPVVTIGVFYLLFYGYHHPPIFDFARMDLYLNYFYLLGLFITAILLWIPIIYPKQMSILQRRMYLVGNIAVVLPLAVILITAKESLYTIYSDLGFFIKSLEACFPAGESLPPEYFQMLLPFNPVEEQFKGGIVLMAIQFFIFGMLLVISFVRNRKQI
ncbi:MULTISPECIES: cytochrome c oxidase assembly protein [unclassified Virgibacillus]|uniref:cytochrome c oxidase assembly protein n=1 Tax=unclassified Virgibacillus TaxID=2620237 RepID=UPI0024DE82B3|nr:cytochrome c oxidase assembly protein [Virgibacillus sp. LDC-1]